MVLETLVTEVVASSTDITRTRGKTTKVLINSHITEQTIWPFFMYCFICECTQRRKKEREIIYQYTVWRWTNFNALNTHVGSLSIPLALKSQSKLIESNEIKTHTKFTLGTIHFNPHFEWWTKWKNKIWRNWQLN